MIVQLMFFNIISKSIKFESAISAKKMYFCKHKKIKVNE